MPFVNAFLALQFEEKAAFLALRQASERFSQGDEAALGVVQGMADAEHMGMIDCRVQLGHGAVFIFKGVFRRSACAVRQNGQIGIRCQPCAVERYFQLSVKREREAGDFFFGMKIPYRDLVQKHGRKRRVEHRLVQQRVQVL